MPIDAKRQPMKICMLSYSFYEADARIKQYAAALVERGDTVDVIALRQPGQPARAFLNGVKVFRLQTRTVNERRPLSYLFRITRFLAVSAIFMGRPPFSEPYQPIYLPSGPAFFGFSAN